MDYLPNEITSIIIRRNRINYEHVNTRRIHNLNHIQYTPYASAFASGLNIYVEGSTPIGASKGWFVIHTAITDTHSWPNTADAITHIIHKRVCKKWYSLLQ